MPKLLYIKIGIKTYRQSKWHRYLKIKNRGRRDLDQFAKPSSVKKYLLLHLNSNVLLIYF